MLLGGFAEDHVEANLACIKVSVIPGPGIEGGRPQIRLKSEGAQDFHRITANLDACPDTSEARGLLVDGNVNTNPPQRCRCGKATDAGSNDSNRKVVHSVCLGRTEKVLIDILRALLSLQEPELFVTTNIVD